MAAPTVLGQQSFTITIYAGGSGSITVPSGTELMLVMVQGWPGSTVGQADTAVFNTSESLTGVALTDSEAGWGGGAVGAEVQQSLWYLKNPTATTANLVFSGGSSTFMSDGGVVHVIYLDNVDLTAGSGALANTGIIGTDATSQNSDVTCTLNPATAADALMFAQVSQQGGTATAPTWGGTVGSQTTIDTDSQAGDHIYLRQGQPTGTGKTITFNLNSGTYPSGIAAVVKGAAGGGATYEESLSLAAAAGVSNASGGVLTGSLSLSATGIIASGAIGSFSTALSLDTETAMAQASSGVFGSALALAALAALTANSGATIDETLDLSAAASLGHVAQAILGATVSLDSSASVDPGSIATLGAALAMAAGAEVSFSTGTSYAEALDLDATAEVSADAAAILAASLSLLAAGALTAQSLASLVASLPLTGTAALSSGAVMTMSEALSLPVSAQLITAGDMGNQALTAVLWWFRQHGSH